MSLSGSHTPARCARARLVKLNVPVLPDTHAHVVLLQLLCLCLPSTPSLHTRYTQVWSTHLMRFEEYPADGPGALRLVLHEEVADQFVLLGLIPTGLYTIRTDPGTPLNWIRNTLRRAVGRMISVCTPIWVALLRGVRLIEPFETHRKR